MLLGQDFFVAHFTMAGSKRERDENEELLKSIVFDETESFIAPSRVDLKDIIWYVIVPSQTFAEFTETTINKNRNTKLALTCTEKFCGIRFVTEDVKTDASLIVLGRFKTPIFIPRVSASTSLSDAAVAAAAAASGGGSASASTASASTASASTASASTASASTASTTATCKDSICQLTPIVFQKHILEKTYRAHYETFLRETETKSTPSLCFEIDGQSFTKIIKQEAASKSALVLYMCHKDSVGHYLYVQKQNCDKRYFSEQKIRVNVSIEHILSLREQQGVNQRIISLSPKLFQTFIKNAQSADATEWKLEVKEKIVKIHSETYHLSRLSLSYSSETTGRSANETLDTVEKVLSASDRCACELEIDDILPRGESLDSFYSCDFIVSSTHGLVSAFSNNHASLVLTVAKHTHDDGSLSPSPLKLLYKIADGTELQAVFSPLVSS